MSDLNAPADSNSDAESLPWGGYVLRSAFQPIYSFSHQRLIGHEALLRATDRQGRAVSPPLMFERCANVEALRRLDRACWQTHARGFARDVDTAQWLFLNVNASAFQAQSDSAVLVAPIFETVGNAGLRPNQIVIELLEAALPDGPEVERWTDQLKRRGFVIALDDFGAGHSNFDRVFRLRPHIVKLDRSVIGRAAADRSVRRVLAQMISLLHECGAQVLVEGVETSDEANIALDSDADFVQGYHFGRPQPRLHRGSGTTPEMFDVWTRCDERSQHERETHARRVEPYGRALMQAKASIEAGVPVREACGAFLALDNADLCYLLDSRGAQVEQSVFYKRPKVVVQLTDEPFAPLLDVQGARWSRRPYFRCAIAAPGVLQVTRPYPTMHSPLLSVTLSVAFRFNGQTVVLCGDKLWRPESTPTIDASSDARGAAADRPGRDADVADVIEAAAAVADVDADPGGSGRTGDDRSERPICRPPGLRSAPSRAPALN